MKKILCYGDSNTYGFNPEDSSRFNENIRWSGILKNNLKNFEVIEQGLNNRTAIVKNPNNTEFNSSKHIVNFLETNKIDLLILAIGANDYQFQYKIDENIFETKYRNLIQYIKSKNIAIIIIPPPIIGNEILNSWFSNLFNLESINKSKDYNYIYKKIANEFNCKYFDFNTFVKPSSIDGLHYTKESHKIIAQKLTTFIEKNFNRQA